MRLVAVALTQRILIALVMVSLAIQGIATALPDLVPRQGPWSAVVTIGLTIAWLVCSLAAIVFTVRLAIVSGGNKIIAFIVAPFMVMPCLGLLLLLRANSMANKVLRDNGAKVGLFGVSPSEFNRLRLNSCQKCGYSTEGIQTGVCPECGTPIPATGSADPPGTTPIG